MRAVRHFIGGDWADAASGRTHDNRSPWSGAVIGPVAAGDDEDARRAIDNAHATFAEWAEAGPGRRQAVFLRAADILETQGMGPNFPMIGDTDLKVSKLYGMLPADTAGTSEGRTPADNATVRNVFIIGPDKKIKLVLVYPMTTGRNFAEILRVIDSMQLTAKHRVATPADWKQGGDVIITGAVTNDEADKLFPGYKTHKPYLRTTPQPN